MFKIAVCDDEKKVRDWLENVIRHSYDDLWQDYSIDQYASGEELCMAMKSGTEYHLVILDIELDVMDGVEAGRYIRSRLNDYSVQIVYISGKTQYAMSLFQNQPFDFLLKPLDEKKVVRIINRVIEINMGLNRTIQFMTNGNQRNVVCCRDILYAFSAIRKVTIHTTSGDYEIYGKLSDFSVQLPHSDFIFIHKSYLVNWLYVQKILKDSIMLHDGTELPISRNHKKSVREAWLKRMEGKYGHT